MKIWMDERGFSPHTTRLSDEFREIEKKGFEFRRDSFSVGDDIYSAAFVRRDERIPVRVHWTNTILPMRWLEVPDEFAVKLEKEDI